MTCIAAQGWDAYCAAGLTGTTVAAPEGAVAPGPQVAGSLEVRVCARGGQRRPSRPRGSDAEGPSESELAYELMVTAGRAAGGIVVNSRRRFLECLRVGDAKGAALELEEHLRILCVMYRLAGGPHGAAPSGDRRVLAQSKDR